MKPIKILQAKQVFNHHQFCFSVEELKSIENLHNLKFIMQVKM